MVFRVEKNINYTVMSNFHLREKNMSLKAKGLLSWMLSNDDSWDYSIAGIVANCKENESAIKSALKELQDFGYLEIKKYMPESRINEDGNKEVIRSSIEYEYIIHEQSINQGYKNLHTENLPIGNLSVGNLPTENHIQISNIERSIKEINKEERNKKENNSFLRQPKLNLYTKCVNLIDDFTTDGDIRSLLITFLNSLSEMNKLKGCSQFQGILKKLQGYNKEEQIKMINYSIEHGYGTFYELKDNYKKKHGSSDYDIKLDHGDKERKEYKNRLNEDIKNGKAEKF